MNNKSTILYTPSGCLMSDALLLYVKGTLKGSELTQAQQHVSECALCADAADGLRMWLSDNKSANAFSSETMENSAAAGTHGALPGDFGARIDKINEQLRRRLHTHSSIGETENKRRLHNPVIWLAAAATILLFIGGAYVIWLQSQYYNQNLAQNPNIDSTTRFFGTEAYEALPFPPAQSTSVLTIKYDRKKSAKVPPVLAIVAEEAQLAEPKNDYSASSDDQVEYTKSKRSSASEVTEEGYNESIYKREHPTAVNRKGGAAMKNEEPDDDNETLYAFVNEMPSFPGGDAERKKFLSKHLRYPLYAAEKDIQGNVYIGFIVKKDGSLDNIKILHGIGGGCDEEALRVMRMMPPWKPGYLKGKKVDVLFTMPVYFKLR